MPRGGRRTATCSVCGGGGLSRSQRRKPAGTRRCARCVQGQQRSVHLQDSLVLSLITHHLQERVATLERELASKSKEVASLQDEISNLHLIRYGLLSDSDSSVYAASDTELPSDTE